MTDQELLQAMGQMLKESESRMSQMMDQKLEPIKKDIAELKDEVSEMKEELEATKDGVNTLLDWAEECSTVLKFPLPRIANIK